MPITPLVRDQHFSPEMIETMGAAYTQACTQLGLGDRTDGMSELVARHIIALAQRGVHSKTGLYLLTVQEFKATSH